MSMACGVGGVADSGGGEGENLNGDWGVEFLPLQKVGKRLGDFLLDKL